jgi:hypothetical protein
VTLARCWGALNQRVHQRDYRNPSHFENLQLPPGD